MNRCPLALVGGLLIVFFGAAAGSPGLLDPDDLAALLTDLEASGGILTEAELATLVAPPAPTAHLSRGSWSLGVGVRESVAPRTQLRMERRARAWSFRLRVRRDGYGQRVVGWLEARRSDWTLHLGGGAPVHGAGLLAAPSGARSSLSTETSLAAPRPGWRASTTLDSRQRLLGAALSWRANGISATGGLARDQEGQQAGYVRASAARGATRLGVMGLRWGPRRGLGADLIWHRGPWRLGAEAAAWWRGPAAPAEHAWLLSAAWRRERWLAELQAASSRGVTGLPGAVRPACLSGWRGRGWAVRVVSRLVKGWTASLVHGLAADRQPDDALGRRRRRSLVAVRIRGGRRGGPTWELRLRHTDESRWTWDQFQPWQPATISSRRLRTWLALGVAVPWGAGDGRLTWRRLEEAGSVRDLLTVQWERRQGAVRWRAAVQMAWGEPLDLVAVTAPVSGLVRLRHWGHWQNGVWLGAEGRGRWRWQLGAELRRRIRTDGGTLGGEVHASLGRGF